MKTLAGFTGMILVACVAVGQSPAPAKTQSAAERHLINGPAGTVSRHFADINRKVLEMAKDFPDDKYDFRLKPEMRAFGEVIIHMASGNVYAGKAGKGEEANWDELDPKNYQGKAAIVALFEKSMADSSAALKQNPEGPQKNLEPFLSVIEHSAEHYGLLVAYYRAHGMTPPESRPRGK